MIPVNIVIQKDGKNELEAFIKILSFSIGNSENTSPSVKKIKSIFTAKKKESPEPSKSPQNTSKKSDSSYVSDTMDMLIKIIKHIIRTFKYVKFKKIFLNYISGGEDPADIAAKYGIACATVYPVLGYISSVMNVNSKKININIKCDFDRKEPQFDFNIIISVRIIFIVLSAVRFIIGEIQKKLKEIRKNE